MKKIVFLLTPVITASFFFLPTYASAAIIINEIMYDLDGTDTGREWIEVLNSGSGAIDLSAWRLFENDANHKLTIYDGSPTVSASGFAIIADKPDQFLSDNPGFSGTIFDSSFSLSNTGETLVLRDENLLDIDSVAYSSDWGAAGDGNSLQKTVSGWDAAAPTPGKENSSKSTSQGGGEEDKTGSTADDGTEPADVTETTVASGGGINTINLTVSKDRNGAAGLPITFKATITGGGQTILGGTVTWNFGDGTTADGQLVEHTYDYPGFYAVTARARYGITDTVARLTAKIVPLEITVETSNVGGYHINITNGSKSELDVSGLRVFSGGESFFLPKDTILLPQATIGLAQSVAGADAALVLPGGGLAAANPAGEVLGAYFGPETADEMMASIANEISEIENRLKSIIYAIGRLIDMTHEKSI